MKFFCFVLFCSLLSFPPSYTSSLRPSSFVLRKTSSRVVQPFVYFSYHPCIVIFILFIFVRMEAFSLTPSYLSFLFLSYLLFFFNKKTSLFPSHSSASVFLLLIFFVCFISWCFFFHFLSSFVYSFLCLPSSSASSFLRSFEKIFPPSHCLSFYLKCFYFYFL